MRGFKIEILLMVKWEMQSPFYTMTTINAGTLKCSLIEYCHVRVTPNAIATARFKETLWMQLRHGWLIISLRTR